MIEQSNERSRREVVYARVEFCLRKIPIAAMTIAAVVTVPTILPSVIQYISSFDPTERGMVYIALAIMLHGVLSRNKNSHR